MKNNIYILMSCCLIAGFFVLCNNNALGKGEENRMNRYNVIWKSPSIDASGQMPIGNGDIAAGVYVIENDALYLLLSKNDAFTYNGDIFKTGRVRVALNPNPFTTGKSYEQTLDLKTGSVIIEADGIVFRIWADANRPVYHIQIDSPNKIVVSAVPELWKRFDGCGWNLTSEPIENPTQDVRIDRNGNIIWYFPVGDRSVFPNEMKFYLVDEMIEKFPDPYRYNTFGNLLESGDMVLNNGVLNGKGNQFDIRIHSLTSQMPNNDKWIDEIEKQAAQELNLENDWNEHRQWWYEFWNKSWITVSDNTLPIEERNVLNGEGYCEYRTEKDGGAMVGQSYNVFRYLMACQSRGKIQAKFNGGLFTQPLRFDKLNNWNTAKVSMKPINDSVSISHEDDRDWGRRFTFQNQRLLYWPLFMSGDLDLTHPFFNYYTKLLPIRKAITKAWFGHEGAYYRENIEPTGGERDCGRGEGDESEDKPPKTKPGMNKGEGYYHSYYFTSGLETVTMMLEYAKYSGNDNFVKSSLIPFAREVLTFFDKHYPRDENGKIRIDPGMSLETWWVVVNPSSDVSGLQYNLDELLRLNIGTKEDNANWKRLRNELPPISMKEIEGRTAIVPGESWEKLKNSENGELYPVFPFRCYGLADGTEDLVEWTMRNRTNVDKFGNKCWTQDQIHWAYAGNALEAQKGLINRYRHASTQCRFPLYGTRMPDSCPDLDHFGSGSTALQRMLVQEGQGKILLLPAWPKDWDVDFKLHVTQNTIVEGVVKDGTLVQLKVSPESRRKDVKVGMGWSFVK